MFFVFLNWFPFKPNARPVTTFAWTRKRYVAPLAFICGFAPHMVKYCYMHVVHLGILQWVNGGALLTLMEQEFFGTGLSVEVTMQTVTRRFLQWCSLHGITPGQTFIGKGHLHVEKWAELRLKAYAARVFTAYMAICLQTLLAEKPAQGDTALIAMCTGQLANFMLALEHAPIYLTDELATSLYNDGMAYLNPNLDQKHIIQISTWNR